jgi:hypothetical protein
MWIGNYSTREAAVLVLRESRGIGCINLTSGAYERLGILSLSGLSGSVYADSEMKTMIEWLEDAEVRVIKVV